MKRLMAAAIVATLVLALAAPALSFAKPPAGKGGGNGHSAVTPAEGKGGSEPR